MHNYFADKIRQGKALASLKKLFNVELKINFSVDMKCININVIKNRN